MVKFDSDEYWAVTTWDRFKEHSRVPLIVKAEFLNQEQLMIEAISSVIANNDNTTINILDLGCGPGRLAQQILDRFQDNIHVTLVDINNQTLEEAKANLSLYKNVSFIQGSFYDINELVEHEIHIIICMEIFHHVYNLCTLLESIANTLRANGILIGNVFSADKYKEWDSKKYGFMKSMQRRSVNWFTTKIYHFCPGKVRKFIRRAGLARIEPIRSDEMLSLLSRHFSIIDTDQGYYLWFCARKSPNDD
jgi:ubiquinone/menaquinone biosynthesis C-methylase UbiE